MEKTFESRIYGELKVRNVMIDDGTNLEDGIEIHIKELDETIEVHGHRDLDEIGVERLEDLIDYNI